MTKKKQLPMTVLQLRDILNEVLKEHGDLPVAVTHLDKKNTRTGTLDRIHVVPLVERDPPIHEPFHILNLTTLLKEPDAWLEDPR